MNPVGFPICISPAKAGPHVRPPTPPTSREARKHESTKTEPSCSVSWLRVFVACSVLRADQLGEGRGPPLGLGQLLRLEHALVVPRHPLDEQRRRFGPPAQDSRRELAAGVLEMPG